jgi:pimeloyl-[acyl-carrier protein] methyl ester esterase
MEQQGDGPDMVFVHGWGMHGGIWGDLPARLADRFRVTVVDLPGHGRSRDVPDPYTLETLAGALGQCIPGPATWVGWSLGGLAVLKYAQRAPLAVQKLVLVGTTPSFVQRPGWRPAMTAGLLEQFSAELAQDWRATLQRFLSLQLGTDEASRALLRTLRREMFRHGDPQPGALLAGLAILHDTDLRDVLAQIRMPALIIHGGRDRLAPPAAADYLCAHMPDARLALIGDAGHAPFLSHAQRFEELLTDFA